MSTHDLSITMRTRKAMDHIELGGCAGSNLKHTELEAWICRAEQLEDELEIHKIALQLACIELPIVKVPYDEDNYIAAARVAYEKAKQEQLDKFMGNT